MKNLNFILFSFLGTMLLFSCVNKESYDRNSAKEDMVYLSMALPESEDIVVTRAAANDLEKYIYTVYLMAFDKSGNCFYKEDVYDGYSEKKVYTADRALGIPKQTGKQYESCTIVLVSNVGKQTGISGGTFNFENVASLDDLKAIYGYHVLQESSVERDCIPMIGKAENVNMTNATSVGSPIIINMERVLARISFKVNVNNSDLEFYFNNWSVESLPRYTYVYPHTNPDEDITSKPEGETFEAFYPSNPTEKSLVTYPVAKWYHEAPEIADKTYGFYMYENRRGGRGEPSIDNLLGEAGDYAGISGFTDPSGENPKFKTLYAPKNASFLILTGLIREKSTLNVTSFTYKIALGANNYNDYNIRRNHNYVYNININGTKYDDITVDVNTFDSRVHKSYALQISAPYSTMMDAHYDKRYLDVTASAGKLDLQFYNNREDAEKGINPISQKDWIVLSEMDTYNIDIDPNESTSKTSDYVDVERKRYYIYTQENLTSSARSVVLKVTHTPTDESSNIVKDPVSRYYTFTQAGIIESNRCYVESYEEYAMDLDIYSPEEPVLGLQWGWSLVKSGNTVSKAYDFTSNTTSSNGLENTKAIVGTSGEAFSGVDINSLYNNYAARYCYNKNKRDKDGKVIEVKWYLPSIDELIPLTNSIDKSPKNGWVPVTMKDREYWSSSVPTDADVNKKPGWVNILTQWIWNWFVGDKFGSGNDYEFRNVARAVKSGSENKVTIAYEDILGAITYYADAYPMRSTPKFVRAVRVKD